jgi:PAS domain S-box-containing protein
MSDLLEHAPCAFLSFSDDGLIRAVNTTLLDLLGYDRDEVLGQHLQGLLSRGARIFYQTHFFPLLRMHGAVEEIYLSLQPKAGEELPVLVNARRNERDGLTFNDCIFMRIQERARFEEELLKARNAAQQANKTKDDFLATLSHELRTPLNPVLMLSTAMEMDTSLPEDAREQLGTIRRNAELEARLIDDLLDLTRINHGKFKLVRAPVDLHVLLSQTEEIVRSDGQGKRIPVHFLKEAGEHFIDGDAARIQQVFWNIVKNAIKFTPVGGEVRVVTTNDEPGRITVKVTDTGIGIDPEVLPRIFEAFEQGTVSTQQFGGLGLGLAITKAIVQMHGGTIRVHSAGRGHGTTFTVDFETCAAPAPPAQPFPAMTPGSVSKLRLLLVEDHDSTREVLARILRRAGHDVHAAGRGDEALQLAASRGPFDILISDLGLPDQSGFELMQAIKARHGWPGIALSGYGMDEDVRKALEAGFSAHLVKPVSIERLRLLLDEVIAGKPIAP